MGTVPNADRHLGGGFRAALNRCAGIWRHIRLRCSRFTRRPAMYLMATFLIGIIAFARDAASSDTANRANVPDRFLTQAVSKVRVSPLYSVASTDFMQMPNRAAVEKAVQFIIHLQPEGTYILTSANSDDVVHMDVAHSAIALAKVRHVKEAKAAMDWILARMTMQDSQDRYNTATIDGIKRSIDYAGSWYDHFRSNGEPRKDLTRGRGEGVGMGIIAVYSIFQDDPTYLHHLINGISVIDRIALAARYLAGPEIQRADGRFNHRPDYRVSFNEEGARMVLGLRLASAMLEACGREDDAAAAMAHANQGLAALDKGDKIEQGMAFDYYALSIWGLATPAQAREEFDNLKEANLLSVDGVRNWDWQLTTAKTMLSRLRWWLTSQSIAPAQTFDWAIANVTIGNIDEARRIEQRWLPLQRSDGGFAGAYLPGLKIGLGDPTSYTAARFILLERLLAQAELQQRSVVTQ